MLITVLRAVMKLVTVDHGSLGITSPGVGATVNFLQHVVTTLFPLPRAKPDEGP